MDILKHCPKCGSTNTAAYNLPLIFCLECKFIYRVVETQPISGKIGEIRS
jgi:hypothetical protein